MRFPSGQLIEQAYGDGAVFLLGGAGLPTTSRVSTRGREVSSLPGLERHGHLTVAHPHACLHDDTHRHGHHVRRPSAATGASSTSAIRDATATVAERNEQLLEDCGLDDPPS